MSNEYDLKGHEWSQNFVEYKYFENANKMKYDIRPHRTTFYGEVAFF